MLDYKLDLAYRDIARLNYILEKLGIVHLIEVGENNTFKIIRQKPENFRMGGNLGFHELTCDNVESLHTICNMLYRTAFAGLRSRD